VVVGGIKLGTAADPLAVQVLAHQGAAVVAHNYTVRVQHRDYLEHKSVSKKFGLLFVAN